MTKKVDFTGGIKFGTSAKELDKGVNMLVTQAANQRKAVQALGIALVVYAAGKGSGNVSRIKTLVDGLGDGVRRDSLVEWFAKGGVTFNEAGDISFNKAVAKDGGLQAMKELAWWEAKAAPNPFQPKQFHEHLLGALRGMYRDFSRMHKQAGAEGMGEVMIKQAELQSFENLVKSHLAGVKDSDGNQVQMPTRPKCLQLLMGNPTATKGKEAKPVKGSKEPA